MTVDEQHMRWKRFALILVTGTLVYNVIEAGVALYTGFHAKSNALVGFGFDSIIESMAAIAILWRFSSYTGDDREAGPNHKEEQAERRVHRFIGLTFFLLAAYVVIDAGTSLWNASQPEESWIGIGLAVASLIIMPLLSAGKLKAARQLNSRALRAEAMETLACSYLSFVLLLGLGLHAYFPDLWWADPLAALVMVPWLIKEGREGFEEESHG